MKLREYFLTGLSLFVTSNSAFASECVSSPRNTLKLCVFVENGKATYEVKRGDVQVIAPSQLGLSFRGETEARFTAVGNVRRVAVDKTWEQPWGEQRVIRDNHNELSVVLSGDTSLNRHMGVTFRLFDDGFGFRYNYDQIPSGRQVSVVADHSQFRTVGAYQAWWYQGLGKSRDEYLYTESDARRVTLAETPLTLKGENGLFLSFHEAALVDFPSMLLRGDGAGGYDAWLMPWPDGTLARKSGPFKTPWRTVLVGESESALADSRITLNLNDDNQIPDIKNWFKPGKYVGVWWEMHLDKSSWGSGKNHGATTQNLKKYIDFASKYGFDGVLAEGWNEGWDGDWANHGEQFSFSKPYPDFDIGEITRYGRAKGVSLIGHHETAGAIENYRHQLKAAFKLYADNGISLIKTGYVRDSGTIKDAAGGQEWFAGQYVVRHELDVVREAAKWHISIDTHEPVKDTGLRRTWPNWVSREGARGQEYNAWGTPTNPPEHLTILPFTRLLGGPMDFTPGIFDISRGGREVSRRVQSTLATQLAQYVVIYSPIQMAADLPENYESNLDAFKFIRDVPTDWEQSKTQKSSIGEYVVVTRQQRSSGDWYLGAITNEDSRKLVQKLDFLEHGQRYEAQIYADGPGADFRTNPEALTISTRMVTSADTLDLNLAPGGGTAIRFKLILRDNQSNENIIN